MLDLDQLRAIFSRFSYIPGWSWHVWLHPFEGLHLTINASVMDAYHPDQTLVLNIHSPLPPFFDEDQVKAWMSWRLARVASHESREFLRHDGVVVSDPHVEEVKM
ncbi:MAG TPA: hypothetical protein VGW38_00525 [Chloroflexota bacterium]|nr:hypothetical protein [Chloroflexota bacterium]